MATLRRSSTRPTSQAVALDHQVGRSLFNSRWMWLMGDERFYFRTEFMSRNENQIRGGGIFHHSARRTRRYATLRGHRPTTHVLRYARRQPPRQRQRR